MKDHASPKARRRCTSLSWTGIGGRHKDQVRLAEKARQGACAVNRLLKTARSRAERDARDAASPDTPFRRARVRKFLWRGGIPDADFSTP
ncbi:hypothetical protein ACEPUD_14340 [Burkholderia ubonensis]|uniref:hypothetical protein n=1 Tax=Burkholderia ubonensis TaxID=101571 RepID=UPI00358FCC85